MGGRSSKHPGKDRSWSLKHRFRSHSLPFLSDRRRRIGGKFPEYRREAGYLDEAMMKSMNDAPAAAMDGGKETSHIMMWPEKTEQRQVAVSPGMTSTREAEVINVWEIMDGLEDASLLHFIESSSAVDHLRRYHSMLNPDISGESSLKSPPPPADSVASDFRLEFSSSLKKALRKLSPQHQSSPWPDSELLGASSTPNTPPAGSFDSDIDQDFLFAFEKALNEPSTELQHQPRPLPDSEILGGVPPSPNWLPVDSTAPYFDPEFLSAFESALNETSTRHQSPSPLHSPGVGSTSLGFDPEILAAFNKTVRETSPRNQSISPLHSPPTGSTCFDFDPEVLTAFDKSPKTSPRRQSFTSQHSQAGSVSFDFDPEILAIFNKALTETFAQDQSHSTPQSPVADKNDDDKKPDEGREAPNHLGIVEARVKEFQQKIDARKNRSKANRRKVPTSPYRAPTCGDCRVVLYFTSIRGIRRTFEECVTVRLILKGTGARIDERDVSMHEGYKQELIALLGPETARKSLPRVFADGKYLGGAEEVRALHETGKLREILESCTMSSLGSSSCEACGDVRFVLCERCAGSCKVGIQDEDYEKEEEKNEEGEFAVIRKCPDCNENGLVRCPLCY